MVQSGHLYFARNAQQVELLQDPGQDVAWDKSQHPEHDYCTDELAPGTHMGPGLGVAEQLIRRRRIAPHHEAGRAEAEEPGIAMHRYGAYRVVDLEAPL